MGSSHRNKKLLGGLFIALCISAATAPLLRYHPLFLNELENRTWDWRVQATAGLSHPDSRIKLIVIDQSSLDFLEREYGLTWPIPRDAYTHVISFLTAAGAKGIAFDMLFTESSAQSVEGDAGFAAASGGSLPVVSALSLERFDKFVPEAKRDILRRRTLDSRLDTAFETSAARSFQSATLPIPELLEQSSALGSVHAMPDSDGVYRRHEPAGTFASQTIPSLPVALYAATTPELGNFKEFLDAQNRLIVRLHGERGAYETISFAAVLQADAERMEQKAPQVPLETFKGSYVFLGATAPGLLDLRPTSLNPRAAGVSLNAAVLDNLLNRAFVRELPLLPASLLALAGIALSTAAPLLGRLSLQLLIATASFGAYGALTVWGASHGLWIPLVVPVFGMVTAAFGGLTLQYQLEGKQHRFLRHAFQHYVSSSVVDQIVENPAQLALGGEKRVLTIFFSDIAGFTGISERLDPKLLVELLNDYLSIMTDTILSFGGTVDKFVGDAVVAFWNAPVKLGEHESRGLRAAITCQQELVRRQEFYREQFGVEVKTRIGLHTDAVNVGNFGSRSRFNYTVLGDGANLASRLEGVNKQFGTLVLFSETVERAVSGSCSYRRVGAVRVVGREQPVAIYEPQLHQAQPEFTPERLAQFAEALRLFDLGSLSEAERVFQECTGDPVAEKYLGRIHRAGGIVPQPWDPVWSLSEK